MGRGPARDRLPEYVARIARAVARGTRDAKGLTNEDIAHGLDGWDARGVRDVLARGRPLRAKNAETLLKVLRKAKARAGSLYASDPRRADVIDSHVDTVLVGVATSQLVPAALIPKWAIRRVADYLAHSISQLSPGINRKRYAELIRRVLNRTAGPMAQQCYQYYKGQWVEGCPADLMLRQYGLPDNDEFLVYEKE